MVEIEICVEALSSLSFCKVSGGRVISYWAPADLVGSVHEQAEAYVDELLAWLASNDGMGNQELMGLIFLEMKAGAGTDRLNAAFMAELAERAANWWCVRDFVNQRQ